jgi:hypothetical protein
MNKYDSKHKKHRMIELSDLWVPLALLGLIVMAAVFFSQKS